MEQFYWTGRYSYPNFISESLVLSGFPVLIHCPQNRQLLSKKSKFRVKKSEMAVFWTPCLISLLISFVLIDCLELIWCFIIKGTMGVLCIVKFYVIVNSFCELLLRFVLWPIDLFPLHEREKWLHDSVVMRLIRSGERLDNLVHEQQFAESLGGILCSLVTVEHQRLGSIPVLRNVDVIR